MRRWNRILALLCLLALLAMPLCVRANDLGYVVDDANLLTDVQWRELSEKAEAISQEYGCGVYIITVTDYHTFDTSPYRAATTIFTDNGFGLGADRNGVLLLMSMNARDYALIAHGELGNAAFTDYGQEKLADRFLDNFAKNDWNGGFADYLRGCERYLKMARAGKPFDVDHNPGRTARAVGIAVAIGCLVALIVCLVWKGKMKSVRRSAGAAPYIVANSRQLRASSDRFTHATHVTRRIESSSRSGGSHGGTSIGHGGFSGRSGKF